MEYYHRDLEKGQITQTHKRERSSAPFTQIGEKNKYTERERERERETRGEAESPEA